MVLRLPFRRPHSCARRSLFWEENWNVPTEDWTHQMQLRIDGVWSISNRNWNKRSFLFPAKEEGDVNINMTMTRVCVCVCVDMLSFVLLRVLVHMWKCVCVYLKVGQEAGNLCPSCLPCQTMVMGNLGIPGTGSYWTGSLSQCMQVPRRNTKCAPEANTYRNILIIHKCNHSHKSWIQSIKKSKFSLRKLKCHTVMCCCIQPWKRQLSFRLQRDWGPWTHPLVVMGTRPGWRQGLIFIFLVWSVRATVPLIRMLTWPAILYGDTGKRYSQINDTEICKRPHHSVIIFFS